MLDFMAIRYDTAHDVKVLANEIIETLSFYHIIPERVLCVRSRGSRSKRTIARIHGLPRIWQEALNTNPYYIIEVISERYDNQTEEEKEKTIIHELLHIPKGFKGGFRYHKGWITKGRIESLYRILVRKRRLSNY